MAYKLEGLKQSLRLKVIVMAQPFSRGTHHYLIDKNLMSSLALV